MSTVAERVAAGIALLDEKVPNWRDKIDLATLELRLDHKCILGQIYTPKDTDSPEWESGYAIGCKVLDISICDCCHEEGGGGHAADFGFNISLEDIEDFQFSDDAFQELQEEWEHQLSSASA